MHVCYYSYEIIHLFPSHSFKGIDRPFRGGGGGGREYTHLIPTGKLEARIFFLSYFKEPSSQDQQKTFRRHLINF